MQAKHIICLHPPAYWVNPAHHMNLGWINKCTSFSCFSHNKPDGLMFIFSLFSSMNFLQGTKSGGCFCKVGTEMSGSDGIQQRLQCSSEGMVWTGCMLFADFLYQSEIRSSNGTPFGSGGLLGLGGLGLIWGRPYNWWAWAMSCAMLRECRCDVDIGWELLVCCIDTYFLSNSVGLAGKGWTFW